MESLTNLELERVSGGNLSDFTTLFGYYSSTGSFEGFNQSELTHNTNRTEIRNLMNYIAEQVDLGIPSSIAYADYYYL